MRIVCGEQIGTARLSNAANHAFSSYIAPFPRTTLSPLVPSPLCSCGGWRTLSLVSSSLVFAPLLVSPGGAVGRVVLCLLDAVGSFGLRLVSAVGLFFFLARYRRPAHPVPVPVADTVSVPYPVACLVCPVACGRGRRPTPSIHRNVVSACFVSVSFLVPSRCPFCFSSLFAPSCDTVGGELVSCLAAFVLGLLVARSRCLPSLRRGGSFSCPHGVLSSRVVCRNERRAVWIVWLERLLAVLVVY